MTATESSSITFEERPKVLYVGSPPIEFHSDGTIRLSASAKPDDAAREMLGIVLPAFAGYLRRTLHSQVHEFHSVMGQPIATRPTIPSCERVRLRASLILEETFEIIEAMFDDVPSGEMLCDPAPVDTSTIAYLKEIAHRFVREAPVNVNMVEFADGCADLDYVVEGARLEFGVSGGPIAAEVHRSNMTKAGGPMRADGKIQKPATFSPPDIAGELAKQGWGR